MDNNLEDTTTSYEPGIILIFSTLKLNVKFLSVSPTVTAYSFDVSFFLSRTISLTTPAPPTTARSGNWYTAAALSNFSNELLSSWKHASCDGRDISFSGGAIITCGSAKKYFTFSYLHES